MGTAAPARVASAPTRRRTGSNSTGPITTSSSIFIPHWMAATTRIWIPTPSATSSKKRINFTIEERFHVSKTPVPDPVWINLGFPHHERQSDGQPLRPARHHLREHVRDQ